MAIADGYWHDHSLGGWDSRWHYSWLRLNAGGWSCLSCRIGTAVGVEGAWANGADISYRAAVFQAIDISPPQSGVGSKLVLQVLIIRYGEDIVSPLYLRS